MGKIFHKLLAMTERFGILTGDSLPHESRNPHFPTLRSGHRLFQRLSLGKQFPSNNSPYGFPGQTVSGLLGPVRLILKPGND